MSTSASVMDQMDQAMPAAPQAVRTAANAGSREVRNLIADVEDIIKRVAHIDDVDLARARAKVEHTLEAAKASLQEGSKRVKATAGHAVTGTDEFVHSNPWSAIGIAAAAGAAIAVLLTTRLRQ
jgi:ElaB/YqjD/DUF883 family membrane-anchored ribosome-binding protein